MGSLLPILILSFTTANAVPGQFTHQGRILADDGTPMTGEATITFRVTNAETGGTSLWDEELTVLLNNGFYAAVLGADEAENPLDTSVLQQAPVWLELQLDGEPAMFPRSPIHAVPYATISTVAGSVSGGPVNATEIAVDGTTVVDGSGNWVGPAPTIEWDDIDGVPDDAFDALAVSCEAGDIPVLDAGSGMWVCGWDNDSLADIACTDGQLIQWSDASLGFVCAEDADTVLTADEVDAIVADNGYAMAADVFSGSYNDLTDKPSLFSGSYNDLSDKPSLFSGSYNDLADKPTLFSGSYDDLTDKPTLFSGSFSELSDVPEGLSDGDDNTQLTAEEVNAIVAAEGYAKTEDVFSGSFSDLSGVPDRLTQPRAIEPFSLQLANINENFGRLVSWAEPNPYLQRFFSDEGGSFSSLQIYVREINSMGATMDLALYTHDGGSNYTRVGSATYYSVTEEGLVNISFPVNLSAKTTYYLVLMDHGYNRIMARQSGESIATMTPNCASTYLYPPATLYQDSPCTWTSQHSFWFRLLP